MTPLTDWFPVIFGVILVLVIAVFAYVIYATIRNRRALRRAGHDPVTIQADLADRVLRSDLLSSGPRDQGLEQRLAEVDRLHAAGTISDEERTAARARILGG